MRATTREATTTYAILGLGALLAAFPLLYVLLTALTPAGEAGPTFTWPSRLDFSNLATAWTQGHFATYIGSSVIVSVSVVALSATLSIMAGFAFAKLRFRGRGFLLTFCLLGMLLPLEGYIIPLYYGMRSYGLLDTYPALILPQVAQSIGFGSFWMASYFRRVPTSILEAARLDGASDWRVLWRILVPVARPAIITMIVLVFMWTWNDFLLSLVMVTSESRRTAPLGLAFFRGQYTTDYALLSAAALIVALPVIIVYIVLRRRFMEGMLGGALRG